MSNGWTGRVAGWICIFLLLIPALFAQVDTGAILGTVYDATGAIIPGAQVTITHEGTGAVQTAQTRGDGTYIFTPVRIGSYTVEVELTGFQKARRSGVEVSIQQQLVVDFSLTPGEVTETINVEAALPTLQTQDASVGEVVGARSINNLPLNGRNYNFLARLTAGVTHSQPEGRGLAATGWFAANGTRPAQNNFLLDGIDNNSNNVDFLSGAAYVLKPPVDDGSTGRAQFLLSPTNSDGAGGIGPSQVQASNFGWVASRKYYTGLYFQDDWKVSSKLTLNLGVRWDHFGLVGDRYDAQGNFSPDLDNPILYYTARRNVDDEISTGFREALARDGISLVSTDEFGSGFGNAQKLNFAPRIGFAYRATDTLVFRGGYGLYYGAFENRGGFPSLGYNYPFQFDFSFFRDNDVSPVRFADGNFATLERGLSSVPLQPLQVSGFGLNLRGIEFDYKTPYVQSLNFTIQYQIAPQTTIDVGYVGSLSRHLETFTGANRVSVMLPPGTNQTPYTPWPSFARNSSYATTEGNAHYHSLQTKLTRRFANGLDFLATYTWAKTLTNAGDLLSGGNAGGFRAPDLPGFGIRREMGLASFHVEHAFTFSGIYELPFGRGRKFMNDPTGAAQAILGGWSINWITSVYSGQPQNIGCTISTSIFGCFPLLTGENLYIGEVNQWYNPAAFTNPPVATSIGQTDFAPLGGYRTPVTGPPYRKLDFSLFKSFQVKERYRFEFRAEAFNLTNTPAFANPSNTNFADKVSFGRVTATRNSPNDARQVQLALKFYW